jgi:hypothetical protein
MYVLGVHSDGDYFKVALIKNTKKKTRIVFLEEFKKDIVDLNHLRERLLREPNLKIEELEVVSLLNPDEVFTKNLTFPFKNKSAIYKALPFQLEKLFPMSSEHITTHAEIEKEGKGANVTLYSYFNETLDLHLEDIQTLGLESDSVTAVSKAILGFKKFFIGKEESAVIFYLGWEKSYIVYTGNNTFKENLLIELGFKHFIDAAREDFSSINQIDSEFIKKEIRNFFSKELLEGALKEVFQKLQKNLFRSFEYIKKKEKLEEVQLLVLGYSDIADAFVSGLKSGVSLILEISPHLEFCREDLKAYAIEIGAALEVSENPERHFEFRSNHSISEKWVKKIETKKKLFFSLALCFSLITTSLSFAFLIFKQREIKRDFSELVKKAGEKPIHYKKMEDFLLTTEALTYDIKRLIDKIKPKKDVKTTVPLEITVGEIFEKIPKELNLEEFSYYLEDEKLLVEIKFWEDSLGSLAKLKENFSKDSRFQVLEKTSGESSNRGLHEFQIIRE